MRKIPHALDTGGGAARYDSGASSLDRFQAQPKWEMSAKGYFVSNTLHPLSLREG
jgi:hypothetical protein